MSSVVVDNWLDQKQNVLDKKALNSLVELTLANKKNAPEEHKDILEQSSKQLKLQKKDQLHEFRDKVRRLWNNYKSPRRTIANAHSEFHIYRTGVIRDYENKESFNVSAAMRENKHVPSLPAPTFPECDPVVQAGDRFFPCCPRTGEVLNEVLENPFKVTLADMNHMVVITPHSKSLHILESVQQMLGYGELIGLTRETMASVFKELIRTHLPSHYGIFNLLSDPNEIFDNVVSLVNYDALIANIKKAIMNIERKVKESVEGPLNTYKSLLLEASGLENPLLERYKAVNRAEKQCINVAGFLVEPELKISLDLLRARYDYRMEKRPALSDIVEFITDMERMDVYRLKSPKMLLGNTINCSLFNNDVFAMDGINTGQSSSWSEISVRFKKVKPVKQSLQPLLDPGHTEQTQHSRDWMSHHSGSQLSQHTITPVYYEQSDGEITRLDEARLWNLSDECDRTREYRAYKFAGVLKKPVFYEKRDGSLLELNGDYLLRKTKEGGYVQYFPVDGHGDRYDDIHCDHRDRRDDIHRDHREHRDHRRHRHHDHRQDHNHDHHQHDRHHDEHQDDHQDRHKHHNDHERHPDNDHHQDRDNDRGKEHYNETEEHQSRHYPKARYPREEDKYIFGELGIDASLLSQEESDNLIQLLRKTLNK